VGWIHLDRLISISHHRRLDPRKIDVYWEPEVYFPRPRNLERASEVKLASEDEQDQYEEEEDEY